MWKIGELARRTGLTVRTLHHYDEIGLLSPAQRSDGGHRVYDEASVQRLYRIVSLRSLGFPLDAIAQALDSERFDPRAAVEDHLRRLEAQIAQEQRLVTKLRALTDRLGADDFLTTIEELTMRERYYTPEQLVRAIADRPQLRVGRVGAGVHLDAQGGGEQADLVVVVQRADGQARRRRHLADAPQGHHVGEARASRNVRP